MNPETERQSKTELQPQGEVTKVGGLTVVTPTPREIRAERTFNAKRDRVWKAFTDPQLIAQWWGRGHKLIVEKMEVTKGGHWRFVEQGPEGPQGFEGRYREIAPQEKIVQSFEWDGMPGHPCVETATFEDLGDKTRVISTSLFMTEQERDGMASAGMADGMEQSYSALDKLLAQQA
jgi:uncharacterized protein YndB with AHSA1/START domain